MPVFRMNTRYEDKNGDIVWHGGKTIHVPSLSKAAEVMSHNAPQEFEVPDNVATIVYSVTAQH